MLDFSNIGEKIVKHQARKYGETKFGMERFIRGFLDLITISFISRFGKRPMHFFGAIGSSYACSRIFCLHYTWESTNYFLHPSGRLITEKTPILYSTNLYDIGFTILCGRFLRRINFTAVKKTQKTTSSKKIFNC